MNSKNYPKIFRISVPSFKTTRGKHYLTPDEVKELFEGMVVIEEKIDGKIDGAGVEGKIVFFEFMKFKHNIHYKNLPSFKIAFDVWDESKQRFLNLKEKQLFLGERGWFWARVIFWGKTSYKEFLNYLPKILEMRSSYGEQKIEGVVIKNYGKQLFGKVVNPEFEKEIDESGHWLKRQRELNRIGIRYG